VSPTGQIVGRAARLVRGAVGGCACFVGAAIASDVQAGPASADHLPFPARIESVIDRGEIEGHRVSILRFESLLPAQVVLQRARAAWGGGRREPVVEADAGAWRTLSTHDTGSWRTLQVRARANGGSEGMLSVWNASMLPPGAAPADGAAFDVARHLPGGATVLRRLGSVDAGRHSASLVALVPGGPQWTADALHASLSAAAFTRDPVVREPARWYRRPGVEVAFTVHPHEGRTALVVHVTRSPR
jgi:hypothetical protein